MDLNVLESCLKNVDSRYRAVIVAARRSKQIQKGASPVVKSKTKKAIAYALIELAENRIAFAEQTDAEMESDIYYSTAQERNIVSSGDRQDLLDLE